MKAVTLSLAVLSLALSSALAGCGPAFEGTYSGTLYSTISCGGQSDVAAFDVTWLLTDEGDRIVIATGGTCGNWNATPSGDSADIHPKACPAYTGGGFNFAPTLTDGTVTVDGDRLDVAFEISIGVTGGATGVCSDTTAGTLARE